MNSHCALSVAFLVIVTKGFLKFADNHCFLLPRPTHFVSVIILWTTVNKSAEIDGSLNTHGTHTIKVTAYDIVLLTTLYYAQIMNCLMCFELEKYMNGTLYFWSKIAFCSKLMKCLNLSFQEYG